MMKSLMLIKLLLFISCERITLKVLKQRSKIRKELLNQQRFIFTGKQLENENKHQEQSIQNDFIHHTAFRLRG
jgi:hypothetical protein